MWTSDAMGWWQWLRLYGVLSVSCALGSVVWGLALVPMPEVPRFGLRGKRRVLARRSAGFAAAEPVVRRVAGWLAFLPDRGLRDAMALRIRRAGEPAGLNPDEWVALSLLSCLGPGWASASLVRSAGFAAWWSWAVLLLAAILPAARLVRTSRERAKQLERSLPTAMDLCVLCMGAGADFPAALEFVVNDLGTAHSVCQEELSLVLEELGLGRTRIQALTGLGERTDSSAVREFIAAVCQSETKGTPLVQALSIQASTLRQRRSVLAEEAAAKAGVRLMFPLLLMVSSLLLVIFGPFIVNGMGM